MFQNKHIVQWALYMTICIFVLTACKNEKVIQDKRKDTKTSESTALPCEQSYIDWNNSVARKNEKLYFAIEIKDFIDAYNYCYYQDYGKKYIQSLVTWYSYKQDFGRLKGDMCYEYTENKKILTLPTVAVYNIKHTKNIEAINVNFDDHSYTEKMYKKYEKLCFYCLKMLFPNMEKNKITSLYKKLNKKAYDHIFQTEKGFHSYNLPSDLYYRDGVGIYPYFAYGESVRMCIIPVDQKANTDHSSFSIMSIFHNYSFSFHFSFIQSMQPNTFFPV